MVKGMIGIDSAPDKPERPQWIQVMGSDKSGFSSELFRVCGSNGADD